MKISELVRIKKKLLEFQSPTFATFIESKFKETSLYIDNMLSSFVFGELQSNLAGHLTELGSHITKTDELIANLISYVENLIEEQEKEFYKEGYLINGIEFISETDVHNERHYRTVICDDDVKQSIISDIRRYTNPKYPALEIGPGDGQWTTFIVAGDPLYVVDIHPEFIESTKSKFPIEYQRRLRTYLSGWHGVPKNDLSILPQNQFGFIFAWQVFDFFPLDKTRLYLEQCFNLLRPGGVMMFSYNNCEFSNAAVSAETGFKSWMTKKLLIKTCEELELEVMDTKDSLSGFHWIKIKKSGELNTVKAGQALGEIIHRKT
jgi:phospholipid N-methyltransferase